MSWPGHKGVAGVAGMDAYGTHLPTLIKAILISKGPVIEFGCGDNSTPIVHEICMMQDRFFFSIENTKEYFDKSQRYIADGHSILFCDNFDEFANLIRGNQWGVAFVDSHPPKSRAQLLAKLHHAQYVVCHDTEHLELGWYGYDVEFPKYKYRFEDRSRYPYTTILSDVNRVDNFITQ